MGVPGFNSDLCALQMESWMQQAGRAGASAASAASRVSAAAEDPAGALQEATAAAFREATGAGEGILWSKFLHPLRV